MAFGKGSPHRRPFADIYFTIEVFVFRLSALVGHWDFDPMIVDRVEKDYIGTWRLLSGFC